jgi:putative FmdB family regulatory protein
MPTYGYRCPSCGHEYEKLQKFSDGTRTKCPECGTRGERLISGGAGLVFKGSGFYDTDYKQKSGEPKKEAKKSESSSESSGDKKTTPKGDKKPKGAGS